MNAAPSPPPNGDAHGDGVGAYQVFTNLTVPNAALYRALIGAFLDAKRRFRVHLRPEDAWAALPAEGRPDVDGVAKALDNLAAWGNLRADSDTGRVATVEDFYRRRFIYQLTHEGEAAEEALSAYDAALGRRGALQSVALDDIATQLRALGALAEEEAPDPAMVHLALVALAERFASLAENARAFMSSLQRTIDLHDAEVEVFLAYKDRLVDYLERFIKDLVTKGAEIARLLGRLDGEIPGLLRLAALREAADAAPGADADAVAEVEAGGPVDRAAAEAGAAAAGLRAADEAYALWEDRWAGLCGWFLSVPGQPAQARLLRSRALTAIPQLLAVVQVLNERRSGRSDRSADFHALARWFAEAPDDETRHQLWRTVFGMYPARHLTVDSDTLAAREADPVPAATPWADAPPLLISPRLRETGSYERRGKPNRVADRSELRRHLAELAAKQSVELAAARARLATGGPVLLSRVGELDPQAFGLFLHLLGDALARRRAGAAEVTATSNDGTLEIRLRVLPDGGMAEVRTPHGVFRGPDHEIEIVDLAPHAVARTRAGLEWSA
ncbi:TIGR02677 family protein [Streptomycetaceae bacterium NBC_01309]